MSSKCLNEVITRLLRVTEKKMENNATSVINKRVTSYNLSINPFMVSQINTRKKIEFLSSQRNKSEVIQII
jgi:hypothetical protein